ncbi:transcriptional regulator [Limibacter armeniacum]|uniref:winged helix-turn-helix domain-containing protein n=1 Tax=Limibacter armeniacum TaxID=466084 RepID=UPI002FE65510
MKNLIENINKAFESRIRLGIMSVLVVNDWVEFTTLKETLDATDGNLASHLKALEKLDFIEMEKKFVGRKPNTSYRATKQGKQAFQDHIEALEQLIKNSNL